MSSNPSSKKSSKHPSRNTKKSGKPSSARSSGHKSTGDSSKTSKHPDAAIPSTSGVGDANISGNMSASHMDIDEVARGGQQRSYIPLPIFPGRHNGLYMTDAMLEDLVKPIDNGNYHVSALRPHEEGDGAPLYPIRSRGRPKKDKTPQTQPSISRPVLKRTSRTDLLGQPGHSCHEWQDA